MTHWLLEALGDAREEALKQASHAQIYSELFGTPFSDDAAVIRRGGEALEMGVLDLIGGTKTDSDAEVQTLRSSAADAFRLFRVLPPVGSALDVSIFKFRTSSLAVL